MSYQIQRCILAPGETWRPMGPLVEIRDAAVAWASRIPRELSATTTSGPIRLLIRIRRTTGATS